MGVLRVTVTYADERNVEVKVTPKVQLAFERQYGMGLPKASKDMHNEYLFYLAWKALQFSGQETREFEDFVDSIDDVDVAGADRADPTRSERTPD
jgi:hypothetical protein